MEIQVKEEGRGSLWASRAAPWDIPWALPLEHNLEQPCKPMENLSIPPLLLGLTQYQQNTNKEKRTRTNLHVMCHQPQTQALPQLSPPLYAVGWFTKTDIFVLELSYEKLQASTSISVSILFNFPLPCFVNSVNN